VTGGSNHDTFRGLAQINPSSTNYNTNLGQTLREVAFKAYNNPAARLLDHAFLPGIPMEFINTSTDSPWGFLRNTDYQWGAKIMADETYFFDWFVDDALYNDSEHFKQLKGLGFENLEILKRFKNALSGLVKLTDYDSVKMVKGFQLFENEFPLPTSADDLRKIAKAYMEDAYDFCNINHHINNASESMINFNQEVRNFRFQHSDLFYNLETTGIFKYWHSPNGAVIYYGQRRLGTKEICVIANMEGATTDVPLSALDIQIKNTTDWKLILKTPNCDALDLNNITLKDSEGVVFVFNY